MTSNKNFEVDYYLRERCESRRLITERCEGGPCTKLLPALSVFANSVFQHWLLFFDKTLFECNATKSVVGSRKWCCITYYFD